MPNLSRPQTSCRRSPSKKMAYCVVALVGHDRDMKQPPAGLLQANSPKWHSRRMWDSLGYLRVRSLANPQRNRDSAWLAQVLVREQTSAPQEEHQLCDDAIAAARRYPTTESGFGSEREAWDEVLSTIDRLLESRQARHLRQIHALRREPE